MAKLILSVKGKVLKEIVITTKRPLKIGRDPSNDVVLDNPAVSRFHAEVGKAWWPFYVKDLDSANGTFLNERRIDGHVHLTKHDKININKFDMEFIDGPSDYDKNARGPGDGRQTMMA